MTGEQQNQLLEMQENFADFVSTLEGMRRQLTDNGWDDDVARSLVYAIIMNGLTGCHVDGPEDE